MSLFDWNWRPVQACSTANDSHVRRPAAARCAARVTKTLRRESPAQIRLVDALPHASFVEPVLSGQGPPQAYFARLPSLPTQDDQFCTRHVGERGQRYRTYFVRICLCGHVPHAISLKDAYVPSMLRSRAPSCSQIVKVLFKHPCNIIMLPTMFTNIFILMESWIKHNVTE